MMLKNAIKKMRDKLIWFKVELVTVPKFMESKTMVRRQLIFSGRVQKVGFRVEIFTMAKRLSLTGYAKNLENGTVEVEIQGTPERIDFVLDYMRSIRRIKIGNIQMKELPLNPMETSFERM